MLLTRQSCEEWLIRRFLYLNGHFSVCSGFLRVRFVRWYWMVVRDVVNMIRNGFVSNVSSFTRCGSCSDCTATWILTCDTPCIVKFILATVYGWYVKAYVRSSKCISKVWPRYFLPQTATNGWFGREIKLCIWFWDFFIQIVRTIRHISRYPTCHL